MSISVNELQAVSANGGTIINAGKHAGSAEIRGAIRYRPSDLLIPTHLTLPIASDRPVVLYNEHGNAEQLEEIAGKLRASGFADVRILEGGFAAYDAANAPTQEPSTEQVVPPTAPDEVQALDRRL